MAIPNFTYDQALVSRVAMRFGLRKSNVRALHVMTQRLAGEFDPSVPQVMNMATGAGKTYVMAAFVEYLRLLGLRNVMIVTPGLVVQTKTVANFTQGTHKFIGGATVPPKVITPENYKANPATQSDFTDQGASNIYVFNVQQLIAPKSLEGDTTSGGKQAQARGIRTYSEYAGVLYDTLKEMNDLVILADEHHLYSTSAKAFHSAIHDLKPTALIGLTASASAKDEVIFSYPLYQAIADKNVKQPVVVYRRDGYGENGEYQQLKDAKALLDTKAQFYAEYAARDGVTPITPVMLVVCEDIKHATRIEKLLVQPDFFGDPYAVLRVDSDSMTVEKNELLDKLDLQDSPVRAVVSVNKLKEGWDSRSIAVMVTLRAMDSDILTQQTLGRGLRLPFGGYTEIEAIDTLDIVAHDSFQRLLKSEKVLKSFGIESIEKAVEASKHGKEEKNDSTAGTKNTADPLEPTNTQTDLPTDSFENNKDPLPSITDPLSTPPKQSMEPQAKLREIDGKGSTPEEWFEKLPELAVVEMVEKFKDVSFLFPQATYLMEDTFFPLSKISNDTVKAAAYQVSNDATGVMERYKLEYDKASKRINPKRLKQVEIDSLSLSDEQVVKEITHIFLSNPRVDRGVENLGQIKNRLVRVFMDNAPVEDWTVSALITARAALEPMIKKEVDSFSKTLKPKVRLFPLELPRQDRRRFTLPAYRTIEKRPLDESKFIRHQFYSGWDLCLYTAAAFDSDSAEHRLACDLDVSPDVVWWTRLYQADDAKIDYQVGSSYYPDFIVRDVDGRTWIVEGKDAGGRTNETVQAKRQAAEEAINLMAGHPVLGEVKVGYVIAYEDDIKKAGSWRTLVSMSNAIKSVT